MLSDLRLLGRLAGDLDVQHCKHAVRRVDSGCGDGDVVVYGIAGVGQDARNIFDVSGIGVVRPRGCPAEGRAIREVRAYDALPCDIAYQPVPRMIELSFFV